MRANWNRQVTYSTAQSDATVFQAGSATKFYITDVIISTAVINTVTLEEDAGADKILFKFTFAANGGAVVNLTTPIAAEAVGTKLFLTSTGTGQLDVTVCGFEE